jgi:phospho-N-acetylmuramoyl-pentapeptide-transferase
MIYHLLWYLRDVFTHRFGFYAYQNVMFRSVSAILTSLLIALLIGPKIIRWLMRKKIGDRPEFHHATLNELTKEKANTPTMGGLIIIFASLASTLLWADLWNPVVQKGIFLVIWFGILGGVDDWLKLTASARHRSRNGLHPWEKLIFQIAGAVLIASFLYLDFARLDPLDAFLQAQSAAGQLDVHTGSDFLPLGHQQCRQPGRWYGWTGCRLRRNGRSGACNSLLCRC